MILFGVLIFAGSRAAALEFSYHYKAGDKYRIVSTVNEDVYVNYQLMFRAEIINRISMEVLSVSPASAGSSGEKARLAAVFQSAEKTVRVGGGNSRNQTGNSAAPVFQWSRDYKSEFDQTELGYMTIDDGYYMPMVRNVPVFPGRDLGIGETWSAGGTEVHDFRDNFGIEKPYRIPFTAFYTYLGERSWKGSNYPAFSVSYRISLEPEAVPGKTFPRRIIGASDQVVYWDTDHCQAAYYEELFRTVIHLSDGQIWEYRGRAGAEVVEAPPMNKQEVLLEIADTIKNIPDASVRVSDEGIVISLENIQFAPDSAVLLTGERAKLDKIAEVLMKYPDRDILVGGHTALARTAEGRLQLSYERAQAVAEYLVSRNVRTPDRVVIQGYGAERPVADNRTEEGMRKNRRVEITILEN